MAGGRTLTVAETETGFFISEGGKPLLTPRKHSLTLPTRGLADAVMQELSAGGAFAASRMPMASMAYSALDIISERRDDMAEAMLAYAETDLLLYRSETPELLARQEEGWTPVVEWMRENFHCDIEVTTGVMPITQPEPTLTALRGALQDLSDFELSAFAVLTQSLGSFLLAMAVTEEALTGEDAFTLSRVDEDFQAEQWGEDSIAMARAAELRRDVLAAEGFMQAAGKSD